MKRLFNFLIMMLLPMMASADAILIDGICYNLIKKSQTAEVVNNPYGYKNSITIPSEVISDGINYSVTSIGVQAFYNCKYITSITLPSSIRTIGSEAFWNCQSLDSVCITDLHGWCNIDFESTYSNPLHNYCHLYINGEEIEELIIPDGVSSIKNYAFCGSKYITKVTIPSSVTTIGKESFSDCFFPSITLPDGITEIGEEAFLRNSCLSSIIIPSNITTIKYCTFLGCSSLESISFLGNITKIDESAFAYCTSLKTIELPNGLKTIARGTFSNCSNLEQVVIPDLVWSIGIHAFSNCEGLKKLYLGNSVRKIERGAFAGCKELKDVYCYPEVVPNTDNSAFDNSYIEYATLHIPYGTSELYGQSSPWNQFGTIEEMAQTKFQLTYMVDDEVYKTYIVKVVLMR